MVEKVWIKQRLLALTCIVLTLLFIANLIGLLVDPRMITGAPAWLKPAKFSISTAIYSGTLAWILSQLSQWPKFVGAMATVTAAMLWVEIFIINLQAWRGTTSHFNLSTKLDGGLFAVMGVSIAMLWMASVGITFALFRQRFHNRAFGWALRLGMLITVLGAASGGVMTRPMPGQTGRIIGSHTVGAPDGGTTIPVLGWSAEHGDLRIAHFVGLHGMQALPFLYWLLARKRRRGLAVVCICAAGYLGAIAVLEWQALRGQSLIHTDSLTGIVWAIWGAIFSGLILAAVANQPKLPAQDMAGLA